MLEAGSCMPALTFNMVVQLTLHLGDHLHQLLGTLAPSLAPGRTLAPSRLAARSTLKSTPAGGRQYVQQVPTLCALLAFCSSIGRVEVALILAQVPCMALR